jgi:hypothetical protein
VHILIIFPNGDDDDIDQNALIYLVRRGFFVLINEYDELTISICKEKVKMNYLLQAILYY